VVISDTTVFFYVGFSTSLELRWSTLAGLLEKDGKRADDRDREMQKDAAGDRDTEVSLRDDWTQAKQARWAHAAAVIFVESTVITGVVVVVVVDWWMLPY